MEQTISIDDNQPEGAATAPSFFVDGGVCDGVEIIAEAGR